MQYLNKYRNNLIAVVVFLSVFSFKPLFADDIKFKIQKEITAAWADYLHSLKEIQLQSFRRDTENGVLVEEEPEQITTHVFPCKHSETVNKNGDTLVFVTNSSYTFTLTKNAKTNGWVIQNIESLPLPGPIESLTFPRLKSTQEVPNDVFSVNVSHLAVALKMNFFLWLPSYFGSNDFQVLETEELIENGLKLVRMKFSYEPAEFTPNELLRSGEVFLLPEHSWVIKRARFFSIEPDKITRVLCDLNIEYGANLDKYPLPLSSSIKINNPQHGYNNLKMEWNYQWTKNVPNKEPLRFTLSYYGLPEPDFNGNHRFRGIRYLLMGVGVIMVAFAVYRMVSKKREQST